MKILIASDSFKDALSAVDVCAAIEHGVRRANPMIDSILFPLGDGGEGTSEILTFHTRGKWIRLTVHDPLFRPVEAGYGISGDGQTAFIEMAQAAGLQLLKPDERNPLETSTFGVGEIILDAVQRGVANIVLCIGGSATNDGGIGMATALGFYFYDANDHKIPENDLSGKSLPRIQRVDASNLYFDPTKIAVQVLCDVNNPLYGERGAAYVYARQKGADDVAVTRLDAGLQHLAGVLQSHFGRDFAHVPGAGAAGGLGAGAMAFLGATLKPGIATVLELTNFKKTLQDVDLIITGEGKIDSQTLHGKLISGVVQHAKNIPVVALCGTLLATPAEIEQIGLQAAFSILNRPMKLEEALTETPNLLAQTAFSVTKIFLRENHKTLKQ